MSFAEKIKNIDILTETYINLGPIFFSPRDSLTKGLLVLLHLSLEGTTEVDTDPKGGLVSFKVTPLTLITLCAYATSEYSTREQLAGGVSLKDYKIIWKVKMTEMKTK